MKNIPLQGEEQKITKLPVNLDYKDDNNYNPLNKGITEFNLQKAQSKSKIYTGYKIGGGKEMFSSKTTPTQESHGHLYHSVTGPHKNKAEAKAAVEQYPYKDIDDSLLGIGKKKPEPGSIASGKSLGKIMNPKYKPAKPGSPKIVPHRSYHPSNVGFGDQSEWDMSVKKIEGPERIGDRKPNKDKKKKGKKNDDSFKKILKREVDKDNPFLVPILTDKGIILVPDTDIDIDESLPRALRSQVGKKQKGKGASYKENRMKAWAGGQFAREGAGADDTESINYGKEHKAKAKKYLDKDIDEKLQNGEYDLMIPVKTKGGVVLVDKDSIDKGIRGGQE